MNTDPEILSLAHDLRRTLERRWHHLRVPYPVKPYPYRGQFRTEHVDVFFNVVSRDFYIPSNAQQSYVKSAVSDLYDEPGMMDLDVPLSMDRWGLLPCAGWTLHIISHKDWPAKVKELQACISQSSTASTYQDT